jgi:hypothetical protein
MRYTIYIVLCDRGVMDKDEIKHLDMLIGAYM